MTWWPFGDKSYRDMLDRIIFLESTTPLFGALFEGNHRKQGTHFGGYRVSHVETNLGCPSLVTKHYKASNQAGSYTHIYIYIYVLICQLVYSRERHVDPVDKQLRLIFMATEQLVTYSLMNMEPQKPQGVSTNHVSLGFHCSFVGEYCSGRMCFLFSPVSPFRRCKENATPS